MRWPHAAAIAAVCVIGTYVLSRAGSRAAEAPAGSSASGAASALESERGQDPRVVWMRAPTAQAEVPPSADERSAAPIEFATATEEREYIIQQISSGGSALEEWHRGANAAIESVRASLLEVGAELSDVQCYYGGCIVHFAYPDVRSFDAAFAALDEAPSLMEWTRAVTGPEHDQGTARVGNALVLFRPQSQAQQAQGGAP